jgi:hypothetical protein
MTDDVKPFGSVKAAWMNAIDNNVGLVRVDVNSLCLLKNYSTPFWLLTLLMTRNARIKNLAMNSCKRNPKRKSNANVKII